jgi:hypothetical protein
MRCILNRSLIPLLAIAAASVLLAGCQPTARPVPPAAKVPGAPPRPPGSTATEPTAAPAATTATRGLPPELVKQIDVLIQSHKDYIAAAEKVQDPRAAKDQVQEFRQRTERSSAVFEDILISSGKLPADQKAKFDTYMNAHVLEISTLCRQHMERLEGLLRQ